MRQLIFAIILLFLIASCISHPSKQIEAPALTRLDSAKINGDYDPALDSYYDSIKAEGDFRIAYKMIKDRINKKNTVSNGNYFMMTIDSQRTMQISWGNDTIQRTDTTHYMLYVAERIGIIKSSKNYLILNYSTGSDTHLSVILPINKLEPPRTIENVFCFDSVNNLLVSEYWGGYMLPNKIPGENNSPDTIIVITNLRTSLNQYVVEKERRCGPPMWHYCIDSIRIINKVLYYDWITPDKMPNNNEDAPKKIKSKRRIRITI